MLVQRNVRPLHMYGALNFGTLHMKLWGNGLWCDTRKIGEPDLARQQEDRHCVTRGGDLLELSLSPARLQVSS